MSQVIHLTEQEVTDGLAEVLKSPQNQGLLKAIVIRPGHEERLNLQMCRLSPQGRKLSHRQTTSAPWHLCQGHQGR